MTEAAVVQELRRQLKKMLPQAVVFKLNDLSSAGIPDLVINHKGNVLWIEVKYLHPKETPSQCAKHFDKLQLASLTLLDRQVNAYYLLAYYQEHELFAVLYRPDWLRAESVEDLVSRNFPFHTYRGPLKEVTGYLAKLLN